MVNNNRVSTLNASMQRRRLVVWALPFTIALLIFAAGSGSTNIAASALTQPATTATAQPTVVAPGGKNEPGPDYPPPSAPALSTAPQQPQGTQAASVIDILTVPANGTPVPSISIAPGTYTIRVTGMFVWGVCNAQYCPQGGPEYLRWADAVSSTDDYWHHGSSPSPASYLYLTMNGTQPNLGAYNPNHLYTTQITISGSSGKITFAIHDCQNCYKDNIGSLSVEILSGGANDNAYILGALPLQQRDMPPPTSDVISLANWGKKAIGDPQVVPDVNPQYTIGGVGCLLTSWAMAIDYWGYQYSFHTNPAALDDWLRQHQGFNGADMLQPQAAKYVRDQLAERETAKAYFIQGLNQRRDDTKLNNLLKQGIPVILQVGTGDNPHYVLAVGETEFRGTHTWYINDPIYNSAYDVAPTLLARYGNVYYGMSWAWESPTYLASVSFGLASPAQLVVTDPQGRRSGVDPRTNTTYDEIPGASYQVDSIGADDGSSASTPPVNMFNAIAPLDGTYTVQVIGTGDGDYHLSALAFGASDEPESTAITKTIQLGAVDAYTLNFSAATTSTIGFIQDSTVPTTTATLIPNPNSAGWNNTDTTVNLAATDDQGGSGVDFITFSATGAQPITTTTISTNSVAIPLTVTGVTTITYFATDKGGNVETAHAITVNLDKIAPTATAVVQPSPAADGWNDTAVSVAISATDGLVGSGVTGITYRASGAQTISTTNVSSTSATIPITASGVTTITYFANDVAGNVSAASSITVRVDPGLPFTDLPRDNTFYAYVRDLYYSGAISGYADNTYRPYANTTRGQLAKIVVVALGLSSDTSNGPHFSDVPVTNPFYSYIETAYHLNIISGYSCGEGCLEFRWGNDVTRGQLAKIVVGAKGWQPSSHDHPTFDDVPQSNPFYGFIEAAFDKGILSGYEDHTFRWGNNATRGQISKIVDLTTTARTTSK